MFHFSYALIIGSLLFLLVSPMAGGERKGTIGMCEGIKHPNIEKCTLSIIFSESLCLDIDTCSIFGVGSAVMQPFICDRL